MPSLQLVKGVVIDPAIQQLCYRPYHGHRHGCPNYGKKAGCPPTVPTIGERYDLGKPIYAIYNMYNLGAHMRAMRMSHPNWSDRQVRNLLYWQPRARRWLAFEIATWMYDNYRMMRDCNMDVIRTPEAMGVNVTETLRQHGISLEWPPMELVYQVVLVASRLL